jgi:hypothetical protein
MKVSTWRVRRENLGSANPSTYLISAGHVMHKDVHHGYGPGLSVDFLPLQEKPLGIFFLAKKSYDSSHQLT